jgi:hypothetical protein
MMNEYQTDWQSAVYAAEAAFFKAKYPVGAAVTLKPTDGAMEGAVRTVTCGAAYLEGREVVVLPSASALPVNIRRIGEARA